MPYIDTKNYDVYFDIRDIRIKSSLFEVDEFLAPIISLLNKKGYKTEYCCSGHYSETIYNTSEINHDNCYITFSYKHQFKNIKFPKGFTIEKDEYCKKRFTIRKDYKGYLIDRYFEVIETMKDLINWVNELPDKKSKKTR